MLTNLSLIPKTIFWRRKIFLLPELEKMKQSHSEKISLTSMDLFSISTFICSIPGISGILRWVFWTVNFIRWRFVFLINACNLAERSRWRSFLFQLLIYFSMLCHNEYNCFQLTKKQKRINVDKIWIEIMDRW